LIKTWWVQLATAMESGRLELITSPELIAEFLDVARRPRIRPLLAPVDPDQIAELLRLTTLVAAGPPVSVCRDPSDDYLLALAKASHADVLVSRDEDLLVLGKYEQTEIIHVAEFLRRISAS
jgi:uncharacterized protein